MRLKTLCVGGVSAADVRLRTSAVWCFTAIALGCAELGNDTYVRFAVDGRSYEFEHVEFVAMRLPDANRYFLALGQDPAKVNIVTAVPSGAIQWRMELASVYDLVERDMDLSDVNDPELGVAMQLSLTDDVGVHQDVESSLRLRIANMEDGYVEGSFSAVRLSYVSMTQDVFRRVDVSGDFRAKLRIQ